MCTIVRNREPLHEWYRARIAAQGGTIHGVPVFWVEAVVSGDFLNDDEFNATVSQVFIGADAMAGRGLPLIDYFLQAPAPYSDVPWITLNEHRIPIIAGLDPDPSCYQCMSDIWQTQPPCTAPNKRRFKYAHGYGFPSGSLFTPWVGLLQLAGARSLAMVGDAGTSPRGGYIYNARGVRLAAADARIPIVFESLYVPSRPTFDQALAIIDQILALPVIPDAIVLLTVICYPWIQAMQLRDAPFKSVAGILCVDNLTAQKKLGDSLKYISGGTHWNQNMLGLQYSEDSNLQPWAFFPHNGVDVSSPQQFVSLYQSLTNGTIPGPLEAHELLPFEILEGAIYLANSVDPEIVNQALNDYYQPSWAGLCANNRFGQNDFRSAITIQRDLTGTMNVIAPQTSAQSNFIYPMPLFSERTYSASILAYPVEHALIVLVSLCSAFTLSLMIYIFWHRSAQVFAAAGLPFYMAMGVGCILAYMSVLVWGVENSAAMCSARIWMWTGSLHFFIDPMLASSYRISRIFSGKIQAVKITTKQVLLISLCLAVPQLLINIIWSSVDGLTPSIVTADLLRPGSSSFTTCSSGSTGSTLLALTIAYAALLLLCACILAYRIRGAYELFNDAQPIAQSVFLFSLTSGVVLAIQITLNHPLVADQKVLFGLRSCGTLVAFQGSIALLYLRRIMDKGSLAGRKTASPALAGPKKPAAGSGTVVQKPPVMTGTKGSAAFGVASPSSNSNGSSTTPAAIAARTSFPASTSDGHIASLLALMPPRTQRASMSQVEMSSLLDQIHEELLRMQPVAAAPGAKRTTLTRPLVLHGEVLKAEVAAELTVPAVSTAAVSEAGSSINEPGAPVDARPDSEVDLEPRNVQRPPTSQAQNRLILPGRVDSQA
jgi:hypothetical protein